MALFLPESAAARPEDAVRIRHARRPAAILAADVAVRMHRSCAAVGAAAWTQLATLTATLAARRRAARGDAVAAGNRVWRAGGGAGELHMAVHGVHSCTQP